MKYYFIALKKQTLNLILTILLLVVQATGIVLLPFFVAQIIDKGVALGNYDLIYLNIIYMVITLVITTIAMVLIARYSSKVSTNVGQEMRKYIIEHAQSISYEQLQNIGTDSLVTRTNNDITVIQSTTNMIIQMIIPTPFIIIASMVMIYFIQASLMFIPLIALVLFVIFTTLLILIASPVANKIQLNIDDIMLNVRESLTGVRVIRAFDRSKMMEAKMEESFVNFKNRMTRLFKIFSFFNPFVYVVMGLLMGLTIYFGTMLVFEQKMQVGQIITVSESVILMLSYLMMSAGVLAMIPRMYASIKRISHVLNLKPIITNGSNPITNIKDVESLSFENVSFSFTNSERILENISFKIEKNKTLAIIGSTGSGKSTIARLMLRLHDVGEGSVRINDIDIKDIDLTTLRDLIAYVPQKARLLSGTIKDNIIIGKQDATDKEIELALEISQAKDFVNNKPEKLNTRVGQGGNNFSGGQKQRLSIARAVLKDSPILLFDDSFSALDYKTDLALRQALKEKLNNKIFVIVAQRISTIIDADLILVLDNGKIVASGKHSDLINSSKEYIDIYNSQIMGEDSEK